MLDEATQMDVCSESLKSQVFIVFYSMWWADFRDILKSELYRYCVQYMQWRADFWEFLDMLDEAAEMDALSQLVSEHFLAGEGRHR